MGETLNDLFADLDRHAQEALGARPVFVDSARLPDEEATSLEHPRWHRVNNIACLCIDMVGSSKIDYRNHAKASTKIYEAFTGSLVAVWRRFGAGFYDLKGDGGFALFDGKDGIIRAFLAGETFRTAVSKRFRPKVSDLTNGAVMLATRTALSFGPVIVKRIGARGRYNHNLVWLGSTVNQGMKVLPLADGEKEEFLATPDAYERLEHKKIRYSCGCGSGQPSPLWRETPSPNLASIGVERVFRLTSFWCDVHGSEYFQGIVDDHGLAFEAAA